MKHKELLKTASKKRRIRKTPKSNPGATPRKDIWEEIKKIKNLIRKK